MWSDPIDELIATFENVLGRIKAGDDPMGRCGFDAFDRTLRNAKEHRELENRTGKVGFEATR